MDPQMVLLVVVSALCSVMFAVQGEDDSPQLLSYLDVLKVFKQLADHQQDWTAQADHQQDWTAQADHHQDWTAQAELEVDNIISQIESLIPALSTLHQLVHNINRHVPLLSDNILDPLVEVKDNLSQVLRHFNKCHQTPNIKHQTTTTEYLAPNISESRESASTSEEMQEHHQPSIESVEHDHFPVQMAVDVSRPHFMDLLAPPTPKDSRLYDILANYSTNNVAALNDTAKAFKAVADQYFQSHGHKLLNLAPKIREVKDKISNIRQHVAMATAEVRDMNRDAAMFYRTSLGCVQDLTRLTSAVRGFTHHLC